MITIHCGLHKTGSSSIQLALELCASKGRKIVTPKSGEDLSDLGWSKRLTSLARDRDAILSDENLLGSPYDAYASAPAKLATLREGLMGRPYQILVYLRPHVNWLPSVYLQSVQEGRSMGPEAFWTSIKDQPYLRWSSLLNLLKRESGAERVIARAHTRSRDSVNDFFSQVGLGKPPRTGSTMIRENVSIGAVQAPILVALNSEMGLSGGERVNLRSTFQNRLAAGARRGLSPFPVDIQGQIAEQFRSDWIELAELVGSNDEAEEAVVRESLARWHANPLPFAGGTLGAPLVAEEMLRSLGALAGQGATPGGEGISGRLAAKLRSNPRDVPAAVARAFRRRSAS
jgi:hypothetical protein